MAKAVTDRRKFKTRETPYMTLNKFAEYVSLPGAAALRRRRILEMIKFPEPGAPLWYAEGRSEIASKLAADDTEALVAVAKRLLLDKTGSPFALELREKSADAIRTFLSNSLGHLTALEGMELTVARGPGEEFPKLLIEGVEISVAPDLIVRGEAKGEKIVGLVKFHIVASQPLTEYAGSIGCTVLEKYAREHYLREDEKVSLEHCLLVDVFNTANPVFSAPKSFKKRWREIADTCIEIANLWPRITNPSDREEP